MKSTYYILLLLSLLTATTSAQVRKQVVRIKADSVKLSNPQGTNELILENRTRSVNGGYLYNKQQGITEFRKMKLEQVGSKLAIIGQDTVDLPPAKQVYLLPSGICQDWNGANIVIHDRAERVYLHLSKPENLVDGKELIISNLAPTSDANWNSTTITITAQEPMMIHEGTDKFALDLGDGTVLRIIYSASLNRFVVVEQDGTVNSTSGLCPFR
ncbi:MAG TPA: hypothetical protein VIM87_07580 [Chitinophaga sp.]|uniref:hypothetical protein n=1 Tax=Chitinophaga sp. TaxID=1869181 RepID=UPI002F92AD75